MVTSPANLVPLSSGSTSISCSMIVIRYTRLDLKPTTHARRSGEVSSRRRVSVGSGRGCVGRSEENFVILYISTDAHLLGGRLFSRRLLSLAAASSSFLLRPLPLLSLVLRESLGVRLHLVGGDRHVGESDAPPVKNGTRLGFLDDVRVPDAPQALSGSLPGLVRQGHLQRVDILELLDDLVVTDELAGECPGLKLVLLVPSQPERRL
mmetsp:Transcript_7675/g.34245  ORF Transcript_7675/g.34245 Transcript_7675/m.34245 type:complete len:208 (+) Transcript_7675:378-1001(+)